MDVIHYLFAVDAKEQYPELYRAWREDPKNFNVNGVYPVVDLWDKARNAWEDISAGQVTQWTIYFSPLGKWGFAYQLCSLNCV
jgi:broad specificity phosphatase PhoE